MTEIKTFPLTVHPSSDLGLGLLSLTWSDVNSCRFCRWSSLLLLVALRRLGKCGETTERGSSLMLQIRSCILPVILFQTCTMSSNNHITYFSTYDSHPLSTRASSATLFIPQCPFDLDGAIEKVDMTIAQELLDKGYIRTFPIALFQGVLTKLQMPCAYQKGECLSTNPWPPKSAMEKTNLMDLKRIRSGKSEDQDIMQPVTHGHLLKAANQIMARMMIDHHLLGSITDWPKK